MKNFKKYCNCIRILSIRMLLQKLFHLNLAHVERWHRRIFFWAPPLPRCHITPMQQPYALLCRAVGLGRFQGAEGLFFATSRKFSLKWPSISNDPPKFLDIPAVLFLSKEAPELVGAKEIYTHPTVYSVSAMWTKQLIEYVLWEKVYFSFSCKGGLISESFFSFAQISRKMC